MSLRCSRDGADYARRRYARHAARKPETWAAFGTVYAVVFFCWALRQHCHVRQPSYTFTNSTILMGRLNGVGIQQSKTISALVCAVSGLLTEHYSADCLTRTNQSDAIQEKNDWYAPDSFCNRGDSVRSNTLSVPTLWCARVLCTSLLMRTTTLPQA